MKFIKYLFLLIFFIYFINVTSYRPKSQRVQQIQQVRKGRPKNVKNKSLQDAYNSINDNIKSYNRKKNQNGYDENDYYETIDEYLNNIELHFSGMSLEIGNLKKRIIKNHNTKNKNSFNRLVSKYNENIIDYNLILKMFRKLEGHRVKRQIKNLNGGYGTVKQHR